MMEEFCRSECLSFSSFFLVHAHRYVCAVTQIPLDSPSVPQDLLAKPRPPWIRPLRKKNPSAPRSSGSHESPPQEVLEAFSPSEMFVDMMGIQNSHSGVSPPPGSHMQGAGGFDGLAVGPSAFHHDAGGEGNGIDGMIKPDPMGMSHAEIMALFNGTGVDMSMGAMFSSPTMQPGFLDSSASGAEAVGQPVTGTGGLAFGQPFGRRGSLTKGDPGMVTSPS